MHVLVPSKFTVLDHTALQGVEITVLPQGAERYRDALKLGAFLSVPVVTSEGDVNALKRNEKLKDNTDQIAVDIFWFDDEKQLYAGRPYRTRCGGKLISVNITEIKFGFDTAEQGNKISLKKVEAGQVAACNISLDRPVDIAEGTLLPIYHRKEDRLMGIAVCKFPLYRASNIKLQHMDIDKQARSAKLKQKPVVLWFTGLSGSGKSTIANLVEQALFNAGHLCYTLDGDNVRHGLNRDLGFTDADRVENIRRIGEVSKLMVDSGLVTLVSFISPFRSERAQARSLMEDGEFIEIFIDTPLEVCQNRDVKGLYEKALAGDIKNFTGISSPYEPPKHAEITLKTTEYSPDELTQQVLAYLKKSGVTI